VAGLDGVPCPRRWWPTQRTPPRHAHGRAVAPTSRCVYGDLRTEALGLRLKRWWRRRCTPPRRTSLAGINAEQRGELGLLWHDSSSASMWSSTIDTTSTPPPNRPILSPDGSQSSQAPLRNAGRARDEGDENGEGHGKFICAARSVLGIFFKAIRDVNLRRLAFGLDRFFLWTKLVF
jgi:hypothetical protein